MPDPVNEIEEVARKIAELNNRELELRHDIQLLQKRLDNLLASSGPTAHTGITSQRPALKTVFPSHNPVTKPPAPVIPQATSSSSIARARRRELEEWIGQDIISKVGILITIIGVFIGAKYAIDKDLISPALRIVAGYLAAGVLLFMGLRLKKKYLGFSSILMGGGLAILYFITYIAYSFYNLLPQLLAFAVMLITTGAAVAISLWYNQKIIALIGQVAAYAIPFLLSNNSGNVTALFTYISIINIGLVVLSFKKDWKSVYRIAFSVSWMIYLSWVTLDGRAVEHFTTGMVFSTVNFLLFYITFLAFKIARRELYNLFEIGILLWNALIYFFIGMYLISEAYSNPHNLTLFTVGNAAIHFVVGVFIYRLNLADKTVGQFVSCLGILFITIAVPIELDGNWVTLLWVAEAVALFTIGHKNARRLYLNLCIPLLVIGLISLVQDWVQMYPEFSGNILTPGKPIHPFARLNFYLSLTAIAGVGFIGWKAGTLPKLKSIIPSVLSSAILLAFITLLYFNIALEIVLSFDTGVSTLIYRYAEARKVIVLFIFTFVYLSAWSVINYRFIRHKQLHYILSVAAALSNVSFLLNGLMMLGILREGYFNAQLDISTLTTNRYASFTALALLWSCTYLSFKVFQSRQAFQPFTSLLFNITLLSLICNEYFHWTDLAGYRNQLKLGLSILCGIYALVLIFMGLKNRKKHLRLFGIVLFGITLLKLFFYDLSALSTISKTVVLIVLGALLLGASFLYNKFKDEIMRTDEASNH